MTVELIDVRRALACDQITPCFQPIVELRSGQLTGFEVLARWRHPEHGLSLPENFISLVEENGLIQELTEQILRKAFVSAKAIPEHLALAVNISPIQLHDLSLPDQIRKLAEESEFRTERLMIEITESALLNNLGRVQSISRALKSMGCKLALDDFGTGYSSLGHLQALPFDELKIDRSFVKKMTSTRDSRKIVAAIVELGRSLGLQTVAEGIETEEHAEMLLWLGCEMGQGWLYGRAEKADQIPAMVNAPPHQSSTRYAAPNQGWAVSSLEALPTQRLAQLQAIYDGAPVGLAFVDRNLRYVSVNRRLAEINGISIVRHLGRTVREVIPEAFSILEPYLQRALRGEAVSEVEVSRPSRIAGEPDWIALLSYHPALDEGGEVIGISIAVMDVTARKRLEVALRETEDHFQEMMKLNRLGPWDINTNGDHADVDLAMV